MVQGMLGNPRLRRAATDGGAGAPAPADTAPAGSAPQEEIRRVAEARLQEARVAALQAVAAQYGLQEAALEALLTPPEPAADAQSALKHRLLQAEVRAVGVEMGLVDADVALRLLAPDAITVEEDGSVGGVREALEALRKEKGYLFASGTAAWAQRVGAGGAPALTGVEEAFYRKNPGLRR